MELTNKEMYNVNGGAITSAFINAINKLIGTIFDIGRSTGSSIRRISKGKNCPV